VPALFDTSPTGRDAKAGKSGVVTASKYFPSIAVAVTAFPIDAPDTESRTVTAIEGSSEFGQLTLTGSVEEVQPSSKTSALPNTNKVWIFTVRSAVRGEGTDFL
jgi:hypothetical protein